ncbi:MAG: sulfotransferase [Chloroflexi bacterium]|nr:sulfotransferase [Chloroflexota bacterium]
MNINSNLPIIIGGCHRSGTSLVRRILNSHSRIYCGPEIKFFKDWYGDYINDPITHARFIQSAKSILPEEELFSILGKAFIDIHIRAAERFDKPRWADKNPENVLYLHQWNQLLGKEWYFVQVVRNPLDTLASMIEANFKYALPSELDKKIDFYNSYSEAGLNFYESHPDRSYRIIYESLVKSPGKEINKLMQWLGEKAESIQLDFNSAQHQPGLEDPKIKKTQVVHSDSIDRWKRDLKSEEIQAILTKTLAIWKKLDNENSYPIDQLSI